MPMKKLSIFAMVLVMILSSVYALDMNADKGEILATKNAPVIKVAEANGFRVVAVSCANIFKMPNQIVWQEIEELEPDLLLFIGDIVYLDKSKKKGISKEAIFQMQWQEPHFRKLISKVPYFAIWDDHDAGINNILPKSYGKMEKTYQDAYAEARPLFVTRLFNRDAIDVYKNAGISQISIGNDLPQSLRGNVNFDNKKTIDYSFVKDNVQFIMLDGISSKTSPNEKKISPSIISNTQFTWLQNKLEAHKGLTILSTGTALQLGGDSQSWKQYKNNYNKLRKILNKRNDVIVLTGNIHKSATLEPDNKLVNYYELVTSGVALDINRRGNFLVLDIENFAKNQWEVDYLQFGKMHKRFAKRKGKILLTTRE
jgi:phosphodiesterase/alkaline phosphatase D-like protein